MTSRKLTGAVTLLTLCALEFWLSRLDLAIAVLLIGVACTIGQKKRRIR